MKKFFFRVCFRFFVRVKVKICFESNETFLTKAYRNDPFSVSKTILDFTWIWFLYMHLFLSREHHQTIYRTVAMKERRIRLFLQIRVKLYFKNKELKRKLSLPVQVQLNNILRSQIKLWSIPLDPFLINSSFIQLKLNQNLILLFLYRSLLYSYWDLIFVRCWTHKLLYII